MARRQDDRKLQVAWLEIDALLRDENLIVRLQNQVFFTVALFDHSFQIDDKVVPFLRVSFTFRLLAKSPNPPARMTALLTV